MRLSRHRFVRSMAALTVMAGAREAGGAQELPTIAVGLTPSDDATPALYAASAGIFRRAGLNVNLQKTPNGAAGTAAVLGGTFQFADTNVFTAIIAYTKGVPILLAAPAIVYDSTTDWTAGVVKAGVEITSGRDLNGRLLGVATVGDANGMALMNWMDKHGGDSRTVRQVEIPYPLVSAALEQGRIDAAVLLQPFLSQATGTGRIHIFAKVFDAIAPRFQLTAFVTSASWSAANPDIVRRFARAIREAEIYANAHRTETAPLVAAWAGIDTDTVLHGKRAPYASSISSPNEVQPWIDVAVKYGVIEKGFNAADLISSAVRDLSAS